MEVVRHRKIGNSGHVGGGTAYEFSGLYRRNRVATPSPCAPWQKNLLLNDFNGLYGLLLHAFELLSNKQATRT